MSNLRDRRMEAGYSQGRLGKSVGLSRQTINALENGTMPRLIHAMRIATILKIPVEELFSDRIDDDTETAEGDHDDDQSA